MDAAVLRRHPFVAVAVVYAVAMLLMVVATFRDYGVAWDETIQAHYGRQVVQYFQSGFTDRSYENLGNMKNYGALFEVVATIVAPWERFPNYEARHFLTALAGIATGLGVIALASLRGHVLAAIVGALAITMMPRFYGHQFFNSKDVPFACGVVWSVYTLARCMAGGIPRWKDTVLAGVALGLTLAVRPGGLPLLGVIALPAACLYVYHLWRETKVEESARLPLGPLLARVATMGTIASLLMIAVWPWAHESPILNPIRGVLHATDFYHPYPVLYRGEVVSSMELPWHYLIVYTAITTPLPVLLLAMSGLGVVALRLIRERKPADLLLLCWLLLPYLLFLIVRPNVYDGLRHFLFLLPALAFLAGEAAEEFVRRVREQREPAAKGVGALAVLACLWPLPAMIGLHPYQYAYFNELVGGPRGAAERYESDYWLTSYKEAAEWVNARAAEAGGEVRVLIAANSLSAACAAYFLDPAIQASTVYTENAPGGLPEGFDFYIGTTRYRFDRNFPDAPIVHEVGRMGAVYTVIRGRRPSSAK